MSVPIPPSSLPPAEDAPAIDPRTSLVGGPADNPMERYRSGGVVPDPGDEDPYGAFLRFNKLISALRVRWNSEQPHRVTSTLGKRAEMLDWDPRALRVVENITGILTTLPRRCPGKATRSVLKCHKDQPDHDTCPCSFLHGNDPNVWKGSVCPGESVKAYQHFVRYVRELGIREDDHVDIQQVLDIVQLHLIEDRCAEDIQISGLFEDKTGVVAQKTGEIYYDRKASEAVALREKCQRQRTELYKNLMADRAKREDMRARRAKEKTEDKRGQLVTDLAGLFSSLNQQPAIDTTFQEIYEEDTDD